MPEDFEQFEKRKQDHIDLALLPSNQATELNALDHIELIHDALPDLDLAELNIETYRFGQLIAKPFFVSSMTAGHKDALKINYELISACAQSGWAMGVGSQRRELEDKQSAQDWIVMRRDFPQVSLFSNLGIAQIINTATGKIKKLCEHINAQALIIHCNPLQEVIQPEGTPQFKGCWQALERLNRELDLPIVLKETGCGFSLPTLKRLNDMGLAAVDVSGLGGTHWGRIEGHRAQAESLQQKAATTFAQWGINTVRSVRDALSLSPRFEVWGSGGVRHGLDAARLFALGVQSVGFAKPMLEAAMKGSQKVLELMMKIEFELKIAMFCTGSSHLSSLKEKVCL